MKNLERVAAMLVPATTTRPGEPFSDLEEVYGRLLGQWALEMNHVAAIVGGYNSQQKHIGQTGVRFQLIPRAKTGRRGEVPRRQRVQSAAWALNPEILRRIEPVGVLDRIEASQTRVLTLAPEQRARAAAGRAGSARRRGRLRRRSTSLPTSAAASGARSTAPAPPSSGRVPPQPAARLRRHAQHRINGARPSQTTRARSSGAS